MSLDAGLEGLTRPLGAEPGQPSPPAANGS
jgi:hypothetical protein